MSFLDKWYVGRNPYRVPELFTSDDPEQATPEASGYEKVDGPFDDEDEARAIAEKEIG